MSSPCEKSDLLVFSHLRWDFVYQRPQHLLSRFVKYRRVFFFEEPVFGMTDMPRLHMRETHEGVQIAVPYLPAKLKEHDLEAALKDLVDELIFEEHIGDYSVWYYTPMALAFTSHLTPEAVIFDCMDELSLFKDAPQDILAYEKKLMQKADLVFTGGHALYESKKKNHRNIHPFPSSIDYAHFSQARMQLVEPEDQVNIHHPRIGFYGVIDERLDLELLRKIADLRPEWNFIMVGPVVKIDPNILPQGPNIHYLGKKDYHALPLYLAGWDCAFMPFAQNESTRYISPTKTPEFLASGRPVVSTPVRDIVSQYGQAGLVYIASSAEQFVNFIDSAMKGRQKDAEWLHKIDSYLARMSWDNTFQAMAKLESNVYMERRSGLNPSMVIRPEVDVSVDGPL